MLDVVVGGAVITVVNTGLGGTMPAGPPCAQV
jgi:hypothetical protein